MAACVQEIFPEAKFGVGPVVEDGFYYDIHLSRPLTPEDLQTIEKSMREKVKKGLQFERSEMPMDAAIDMFAGMSQDFKVELLRDLKTRGTTAVADLDDANLVGGSVAEVLAKNYPTPMEFVGMKDIFGESGPPEKII